MLLRWMMVGLSALLLAGCNVVSTCDDGGGGIRLFGKDQVEQKLEIGVKEYEEGNYVTSTNALEAVLATKTASNAQRVRANKYLAFINCVSSREKSCREYFRKVLEINPNFNLSAAEAGHPIWGPVFNSVKGKFSK
ncbi:MAG: TssQ family T6SS-associated lipoprotein [Gallionella sp.]|nr:TssQ family T6SS-associated lipoprotein [Gallionella sp.]